MTQGNILFLPRCVAVFLGSITVCWKDLNNPCRCCSPL